MWSWQEEKAERIAFSMRATGHMIGSRRSGIPPGPTHAALQAAEDGVIGRPGVGGGEDGGPVSGGIHEDLRQCIDVVLDHSSLNSIPVEGDGAICGRAQEGLRSAKPKRKEGRGQFWGSDPVLCRVGHVRHVSTVAIAVLIPARRGPHGDRETGRAGRQQGD